MQHLTMQHRPACGRQHAVFMQQSPWRCEHRPECSGQQWSCSHAAVVMQWPAQPAVVMQPCSTHIRLLSTTPDGNVMLPLILVKSSQTTPPVTCPTTTVPVGQSVLGAIDWDAATSAAQLTSASTTIAFRTVHVCVIFMSWTTSTCPGQRLARVCLAGNLPTRSRRATQGYQLNSPLRAMQCRLCLRP